MRHESKSNPTQLGGSYFTESAGHPQLQLIFHRMLGTLPGVTKRVEIKSEEKRRAYPIKLQALLKSFVRVHNTIFSSVTFKVSDKLLHST